MKNLMTIFKILESLRVPPITDTYENRTFHESPVHAKKKKEKKGLFSL